VEEQDVITKPWIILVGGFLGSGKTTLLIAAAQELERRGLRTAIILNDQGDALVDTDYVTRSGLHFGEVTGGCFCCKLSNLIEVMDRLNEHSPDVIFAEPVGSCTDLSATILHPLAEYSDQYQLAPFTVLVDPSRANSLLDESADPDLSYLFHKQIEEADLVCFSKSDLYPNYPTLPGRAKNGIRQLSAKSGQGVSAWLDEVMSGTLTTGATLLDIDYEQYAQAEAALVWLNLQASLQSVSPHSYATILGPMLDGLDKDFTAANISIVHLKAIVSSPAGYLKGAICANGQQPVLEGAFDASPEVRHDLLLNLRTLGSSGEVRDIVEQRVRSMGAALDDLRISCFHPAAPKPERRVTRLT
jgi:hypothetical protein